MTVDDLITGKYYTCNCFTSNNYIFIFDYNKASGNVYIKNHIEIKDCYLSSGAFDGSIRNIKEATPFEIFWLDECIRIKKYINKEVIEQIYKEENSEPKLSLYNLIKESKELSNL